MLVRLTRAKRLKAGRFLALIYLLCVLVPGLSFALDGEHRAAPCITQNHGPGMHMIEHDAGVNQHLDDAHLAHDRSHEHIAETKISQANDNIPAKSQHKTSDTRCCGLVSFSAIPASEIVLIEPVALTSLCECEIYRSIADRTPPQHYRPPIT